MGSRDVIRCDKKGRIYLREAIRSKYGRRFRVIEGDGELIFLPVPDDPVEALAKLGKILGKVPREEIRKAARRRARKEALKNVRGY